MRVPSNRKLWFSVGCVALLCYVRSAHGAICADDHQYGRYCYPSWVAVENGGDSDSGLDVIIGSDPNDNYSQWIGWRNTVTDQCDWQKIGDSNGFWENITIVGMYGYDSMWALDYNYNFCGFDMEPPIFGGFNLNFDSVWYGDGYDQFYSYGNSPTMLGSPVGNLFSTDTANSSIYSNYGWGDDWVFVNGAGVWPLVVQVGDGNDNVYIASSVSAFNSVYCGDGDDWWCGPGTRPSDCEHTITYGCPF